MESIDGWDQHGVVAGPPSERIVRAHEGRPAVRAKVGRWGSFVCRSLLLLLFVVGIVKKKEKSNQKERRGKERKGKERKGKERNKEHAKVMKQNENAKENETKRKTHRRP